MAQTIENTLGLMKDYLFKNHQHGFWIDFTNGHGGSDCWTTSYVARNLAENPQNLTRLAPIKNRIVFNQRKDGGWGYNHTAASDADTTANCLLFLLKFPDTGEAIEAGTEHLLRHHDKKTGGISTYKKDDFKLYTDKDEGGGWCSSTIEVTSLATRALIESGYEGDEIEQSLDFIASRQNEDGSWPSYWWSSKEYAMVESIGVLEKFPQYRENVRRALEYLTDKRREKGWTNDFTQQYSPFCAALTLKILSKNKAKLIEEYQLAERYQIAKKIIPELLEREIETLLKSQNPDGSFSPEPLFRIPRYDIIDPTKIERWSIDTPHQNSIYTDNNRFFTTATVYSTLLRYLEN